ncbi:MAG: endonuclease/exonuclease/phosphatase family protein [Chloroflexota bacterium]|nr:endonuclease/exonuclease/phosphatase family protein [Chloroflexota bacterium]
MADRDSLLGVVARRQADSLEDAAMDALSFILSRRASARSALSEFLRVGAGQPLSVTNVKSKTAIGGGAIAEMACSDEHGNLVVFIESISWGTLTDNQPAAYWQALSADTPAVLLFLAPHRRIESGSLWDELVDRLRKADVELADETVTDGLITAVATDGRRLMLTSWEVLLGRMAEIARNNDDFQVCFEISQLDGLAAAAVKGEGTTADESLRASFADAVDHLKRSGWANTDRLNVGAGASYYARYFRLAGAPTGLRIDYEDEKRRPDRSLWLWFWHEDDAKLSAKDVARLLDQAGEVGQVSRGTRLLMPIDLPAGTDGQATVDTLVAELERIAHLLDPSGPTYRDAPVSGDSRNPQPDKRPHQSGEQTGECAPIKVVSWNIATMDKPWRELVEMDADVALLQEARRPPAEVAEHLDIGPQESWDSHSWNSDWWRGRRRGRALFDRWPMVVRLSDRVEIEWFKQVGPTAWPGENEIAVSGIGTVAAAHITPKDSSIEPFFAISMYGRWIPPHRSVETELQIGYADASVHRIISDLSAFIGFANRRTHRILAAGDLNVTYGYGHGSGPYWDARYRNLFERFESVGLEFMGPQLPNGRQARLATGEPEDSENVVTYHLPNWTPATARNNQFDYVFASRGFHRSLKVRAMNEVDEWGSSDHCRLLIEIGE